MICLTKYCFWGLFLQLMAMVPYAPANLQHYKNRYHYKNSRIAEVKE